MLLIDIGNSWLKSAYFRDEVLHHISPVEISHFKSDRTVSWSLPEKGNVVARRKFSCPAWPAKK